jgi:hypothetical protein
MLPNTLPQKPYNFLCYGYTDAECDQQSGRKNFRLKLTEYTTVQHETIMGETRRLGDIRRIAIVNYNRAIYCDVMFFSLFLRTLYRAVYPPPPLPFTPLPLPVAFLRGLGFLIVGP